MSIKREMRDTRKEKVVIPDFYQYPIHKRLNDFKRFSHDVLCVLKDWFKLEISLDSLKKLQKAIDNPTPFELKVINSYWSCGKGHYNRKISEIQIASENPHLIKALELYNELREINHTDNSPRTLKDISNMGYVAQHNNGVYSIYNAYGKAQMECSAYDKGIRRNYYLSLNTIWAKSGIDASSKAVMNTIASNSLPIGAIYKEYAGGSYASRLSFSKYIDRLELPAYECPACLNTSMSTPVTKVSLLGYSDYSNINAKDIVKNDQILLVKPLLKTGSIKDFYGIVSDVMMDLSSRIVECNDGIINSLIDLLEGFDIDISSVPLGDNSFEDFLLDSNDDFLIVLVKRKNYVPLKEYLKSKGFESYGIGKVSSQKSYRLINADTELMNLSAEIAKYHMHDYSIFRMEDNVVSGYESLYDTFDESKVSEYIRKDLALGRFNPNSILSGVSSGQSLRMPLLGKKQMTPMHALQLYPSANRFDDACTMITSNVNTQVGKSDFTITVNAVVSALMKLVVLGVPLCNTAVSCNLLYDVSGNRLVRGSVLAKSLACLYAQDELSVGTMGNSIELMHNMEADGIVADITAIGSCSASNTVSNMFKKGDKIYHFHIARDEFDIPDFKYIHKLASQINMYINMGHISAGRVIEYNIVDSIIKGTAGDTLGFSFAKLDESLFEKSAGDILLAVDDDWDVDVLNGKYIGVVDESGDIKGVDILINQEEVERIVSKYPFENNPYFRLPKVEARPQKHSKPLAEHISINALVLYNQESAEKCFASILNKLGCQVSSVKLPEFGNITQSFAIKLREQILKTDILICSGRSYENSSHDGIYNALHNPIVLDALNELIFNRDGLVLSTGDGARAFLELGYLACGNAEMGKPVNLELVDNIRVDSSAKLQRVVVNNFHSPFLVDLNKDVAYLTADAGAKLKFSFTEEVRRILTATGQIAMQFVDYLGYPTIVYPDNPYGSQRGIAALGSPNGKILGLFIQPELTTRINNEISLLEEMLKSAINYYK